jgi:hypothetical protein
VMRAGPDGPGVQECGGPAGAWLRVPASPAWRSSRLARQLGIVLAMVADFLQRRRRQRDRRIRSRALRDALHALDDRTLRDLGFHRDEIPSIVAETVGDAAPSRVRTMRDLRGVGI